MIGGGGGGGVYDASSQALGSCYLCAYYYNYYKWDTIIPTHTLHTILTNYKQCIIIGGM